MEEVPATGGDQGTWIRYIRVLVQWTKVTGYGPWTRFTKPSVPSRAVRLPHALVHAPVLQSDPVVDLRVEEDVSSSCSETIDINVIPEIERSSRVISLAPIRDHEPVSTGGRGPEQTAPRCLETENADEILRCLRRNRILRCIGLRCILTVPPGFEPLLSTSTHRVLTKPVHQSACTVLLGSEQLPSTTTDIVQEPELDISLTSLPLTQVLKSGSPLPPGFEQDLSSGSETTDSDIFSDAELIRDTILLARTAVSASRIEVQEGLEQLIFTTCYSESTDSDGKCDFIPAEEKSNPVHVPCKAVFAYGTEAAPDLERLIFCSSESSDCDNVSEAEGRPDLIELQARFAALALAGNEVPSDLDQTEISLSYPDTTDPDVLSDPDHKRSVKCEADESVNGAANSSTGVRARVFVAEEPNIGGTGCKNSGAALRSLIPEGVASRNLNPNAKEYVPRASKLVSCAAQSGRESDRSEKVKIFEEGLLLSSAKANACSPDSGPGHHLPLDLGTALRASHENRGWTKWSKANECAPRSNAEIEWGSGRGSADKGVSGPVKHFETPSGSKSAIQARQKKSGNRAGTGQSYRAPLECTLRASHKKLIN